MSTILKVVEFDGSKIPYIEISMSDIFKIKKDHKASTKRMTSCVCHMPLKYTEPYNKKKKRKNTVAPRTNGADRYLSIYTNSSSTSSYLHHLACSSKQVSFYYEKFISGEDSSRSKYSDYSHLCHNWWCINPEHIVKEPSWINNMRSCCIHKTCKCDMVSHPDLVLKCPKCIFYSRLLRNNILDKLDKEAFLEVYYGNLYDLSVTNKDVIYEILGSLYHRVYNTAHVALDSKTIKGLGTKMKEIMVSKKKKKKKKKKET